MFDFSIEGLSHRVKYFVLKFAKNIWRFRRRIFGLKPSSTGFVSSGGDPEKGHFSVQKVHFFKWDVQHWGFGSLF
jgi:hypothetical protein